jgi:lipopolysaccharide transport system ATP-binding protein
LYLLDSAQRASIVAPPRATGKTPSAPVVLIGIVRSDGTPVYGVATDMDGVVPHPVAPDRYAFAIHFPSLPLLPGKYLVRGHVLDPEGVRLFDTLEKSLTITGAAREFGLIRLQHRWRMGDDTAVALPDSMPDRQ